MPKQSKTAGTRPAVLQTTAETALMPCGPAHIHAATPRCLSQAHQAACGRLCFRAAGRRASAILKVGDPRHQRLFAKEAGESAGTAIQLQVGKRVRNIARVAKSNDATGHGMADFIDPGPNWRFDMIAALRIRKSLPSAPSLNHENNLNIHSKSRIRNATTNHWFRQVNRPC